MIVSAELLYALATTLAPQSTPATPAEAPEPAASSTALLDDEGPIGPMVANPTPAEVRAAEGWILIDRVEVVVNEDIITRRRLLRDLTRIQRRGGISRPEDVRTYETVVLTDQIRRKLQVQAGQDLGLDPAIVARQVDDVMQRQIDHAGGVTSMTERLMARSTDSLQQEEDWTEELYSITWSQIVTGRQPGPLGRVSLDRYVRPGMRRFVYGSLLDTPEQYGAFGGRSPSVGFQELLIEHESLGGVQPARELAEELRELALEGQDFLELIERFSALQPEEGVTHIELARVMSADKRLGTFLATAEPGEISDVYEARNGKIPALGLARFVERVEPVVPSFDSGEVQQRLEERARESLDVYRRGEALERLFRAAYVWPPHLAGEAR